MHDEIRKMQQQVADAKKEEDDLRNVDQQLKEHIDD